MAISSTSGPTPPLGSAEPTPAGKIPSNPKGALGKDAFLQLLVAQMKNQDPMNPQNGQEMAAQLAQFSSVEQLTQLNETFAKQATQQSALVGSLGGTLAMSAIGRDVQVDASMASTIDGTAMPPQAKLGGTVDGVRFTSQGPVLTMGNFQFPFSAILKMQ